METKKMHHHPAGARILSAALALVLTFSLLPPLSLGAAAVEEASWLTPYLEKLVSWGVMRGDQNGSLDPNRAITRAEFVSMINRAYGYDTPGKIPFEDVSPSDWYYDDISVGYHTGYFSGTSDTTASPTSALTREQATVILGRNLMLQDGLGESLDFSDSRNLSDWSRGLIKTAAAMGYVNGYPDGTFQPQRNISRGEVAVLLVNAIGTPISEPGDYNLGSVYGNVTISSSGVTLRNTVIAGDLYITGGVGLGYITLENVTVLGKIVASGAGESNKGENSIILRNVTAPEMVMDSISNQYVTVRSEGDTKIDITSVRTPSYLEDVTAPGKGFTKIEVNGESGTTLEVAGAIKDIDVLSPNAKVVVAKGSAQTINVDEKADGAAVEISRGAEVKHLNLDVATKVTGNGSIENLTISSAGSTVSMLPDKITIRPGLTANIKGETMDTTTAAESSEDPRILSGYPRATDLAPTAANAVFRTNKKGTIYWAISSIADGSVGEADLINPPSYATKIIKSGSIAAAASNTDYIAKLSGLTSDGSYYISAVLVDARGERSAVKVGAFTTPDGTAPNFAANYPAMSKISNTGAQVTVMPTKTCQLYYALLPKGATAPTATDFKANSVAGNLGFGSMEVTKNSTSVFDVNDVPLKELETYDLYLWLTDLDGAKSSAVKKISFTTVDRTPPVFLTDPTVNSIKETSVGLTSTLNETGNIFWVVVKAGESYPKPLAGQTQKPLLSSDSAKLQVASGMNALKAGKVSATANKDAAISVSGLTAQTAYDFYYLAQDTAGNYSETVKMITIHTLDTAPPIVTQEFTRTNDTEGKVPLADTDVRIVFSESVQDIGGEVLLDLYNTAHDSTKSEAQRAEASTKLAELLEKDIQLWDTTNVPAVQVNIRRADTDQDWTIDYKNVKISMDDGKTIVTFQSGSAYNLNLKSGSSYYFQISNIADTSNNKNIIKPNPQKLPVFKTAFAQVNLKDTNGGKTTDGKDLHMSFQMFPVSTSKVDASVCWDMLLWSDSLIGFELYKRTTKDGATTDWQCLNPVDASNPSEYQPVVIQAVSGTYVGVSLTEIFGNKLWESLNGSLNPPKGLDEKTTYEYGVRVVSVDGVGDTTAWNKAVNMQISIAAGGQNALSNLAKDVSPQNWTAMTQSQDVTSIGWSNKDPFTLTKKFSDSKSPTFTGGFPEFTTYDAKAKMSFMLDRPGTIYYAVAPVKYNDVTGDISYTLSTAGIDGRPVLPGDVPESGADATIIAPPPGSTLPATWLPELSLPVYTTIVKPNFATEAIKSGSGEYQGTGLKDIEVEGLEPKTLYYAYIVLKGTSTSSPFSQVYCFQFTTQEIQRPVITLEPSNPEVKVTVSQDSLVDYILVTNGKEDTGFGKPMADYLANPADPDAIAAVGSMTVLDAMSTDKKEGGAIVGSYFDVYASQAAKNTFASLIRNQTVSGTVVTMKEQKTFKATAPLTPVDCRPGMTGTTWYTFLCVGRSLTGSGDAFRATRPVFLRDNEAPVVTECTTIYGDPDHPLADPNGRFWGYVTVIFNEDLYYKTQDPATSLQKITPIEATNGPNGSPGYKPVKMVLTTLDNNIELRPGPSGKTCSSLTFQINGAFPGAMISFSASLCDQQGNNRTSNLTLTLNYEPIKGADGTVTSYRGYFTITPAWDSTGKK